MYQCSWLISCPQGGKIQCQRQTQHLVCTVCLPEKNKLYHKYKQGEKSIISALLSAPRGDLFEVSKVIERISRVVKLRRKFTSFIAPQVRDSGHEYHVSKLLKVLDSYKEYLEALTQNSEEPQTSLEVAQPSAVLAQDIKKLVEEDPFADFDDAIKEYHERMAKFKELHQQVSDVINLTGDDFNFTCSFCYAWLNLIELSWNSMHHLIKGNCLSVYYTRRKNELEPYTSELLTVIHNKDIIHPDLINWALENSSSTITMILTMRKIDGKNMLILGFKAGSHVYEQALKVIMVLENGEKQTRCTYILLDQDTIDIMKTYKTMYAYKKIKY